MAIDTPPRVRSRGSMLRLTGVGGAAVAGVTGYRVFDNGVRESGSGAPYDAWTRWRDDPTPLGAVGAAVPAANPDSTLTAAGAGPVATITVGAVGGLALAAARWVPDARPALGLLVIGTLPFAALTWWSVVSPVLAVAALAIGPATIHARDHTSRPETTC
jgi:hypothetical protein